MSDAPVSAEVVVWQGDRWWVVTVSLADGTVYLVREERVCNVTLLRCAAAHPGTWVPLREVIRG